MNWLLPSVVPVVVDKDAVRTLARSGVLSERELKRAAGGWVPRDPNRARKLRRLADPEAMRAQDREYHAKNKERRNATNRRWRARVKAGKQ